MKATTTAEIWQVDEYQGKNGYGANVTLLQKDTRSKLEFNLKDAYQGGQLKALEGQEVELELELKQTRFGMNVVGATLVS